MINFAGITHIIENPKEHAPGYVYSLVGSVPVSMMEVKPATRSDVMGGRAWRDTDGALVAPHFPQVGNGKRDSGRSAR